MHAWRKGAGMMVIHGLRDTATVTCMLLDMTEDHTAAGLGQRGLGLQLQLHCRGQELQLQPEVCTFYACS